MPTTDTELDTAVIDEREATALLAARGDAEPEDVEDAQGLAHTGAAHAQAGGELALGGQVVAGRESAVEQVALDPLEHDAPGTRRRGGLCHEASFCGQTTIATVV